MEHTIIIYYAFCPRKAEAPGAYLKYQREIADNILQYAFETHFHAAFDPGKIIKGKHGKPYWNGEEPICFNVSNTEGLVVCGIASQEIGVDAEALREVRLPLLSRSCSQDEINYILNKTKDIPDQDKTALTEHIPDQDKTALAEHIPDQDKTALAEHIPDPGKEALDEDIKRQDREMLREGVQDPGKGTLGELEQERFVRIWTLKESYIKMTGDGMSFPLQQAEFSIEENKGKRNIKCSQSGFFAQKKIKNYWISICTSQPAQPIWQEFPADVSTHRNQQSALLKHKKPTALETRFNTQEPAERPFAKQTIHGCP